MSLLLIGTTMVSPTSRSVSIIQEESAPGNLRNRTPELRLFYYDEERRGGDTCTAFDRNTNTNIIAEEIFSNCQVATLKWDTEFNEK